MKQLYAINMVQIRTQERAATFAAEVRKFLLDALHFCPESKLKWVGMCGVVFEIGRRRQTKFQNTLTSPDLTFKKGAPSLVNGKDKGKGKAIDWTDNPDTNNGEAVVPAFEEDFEEIEHPPLQMSFGRRAWKYHEVRNVTIFDKLIRTGKF